MNLEKKFFGVAVVIIIAVAVMCCSTLPIRPIETEKTDSSSLFGGVGEKETIYFWYTDENMTSFFNSAAVSFGEREGVRVIPVLTSEGEYLEAINHASLHETQVPDVYLISNDSLEKAYLLGLASEARDEGLCLNTANFPQAALMAVRYHGKEIAYPLYFQTSALLYNETYLEMWARQQAEKELTQEESGNPEETSQEDSKGESQEVSGEEGAPEDPREVRLEQLTQQYIEKGIPSTVDDILNLADTFAPPEGLDGIMKWDVSDIFYNYWIVGKYMIVGGDSGDDDSKIDINNEETASCLEVYKTLNQFFAIESDTVTYESVINDFIDGKIMFTVATTDVIERLKTAKEEESFAYEYGIATMPDVSGELGSRSLSVTGAVAVNGYSAHKDLANAFAAYLVTDCADVLYDKTGKVPARNNTDKENPPVQIFKMEYANSVSLPKMMETGNFWLRLEVLFAKLWNGEDANMLLQELAQQIATQVVTE